MRRRNFLRAFGSLPLIGGLFAAKAVAGEEQMGVVECDWGEEAGDPIRPRLTEAERRKIKRAMLREQNEKLKAGPPIVVVVESKVRKDEIQLLCAEMERLKRTYPGPERVWQATGSDSGSVVWIGSVRKSQRLVHVYGGWGNYKDEMPTKILRSYWFTIYT